MTQVKNATLQCEYHMNKDNQLYTIVWTQTYQSWPEPAVTQEPEPEDLTQAREVLARIMSK